MYTKNGQYIREQVEKIVRARPLNSLKANELYLLEQINEMCGKHPIKSCQASENIGGNTYYHNTYCWGIVEVDTTSEQKLIDYTLDHCKDLRSETPPDYKFMWREFPEIYTCIRPISAPGGIIKSEGELYTVLSKVITIRFRGCFAPVE